MTRTAQKNYLLIKERYLQYRIANRKPAEYFTVPLALIKELEQTRIALTALETPQEEEIAC